MHNRFHVHAIGAFGTSVANVLRLYIPTFSLTCCTDEWKIPNEPIPDAHVTVIIVSAPSAATCLAFSRLCITNPSIFIPMTLQPDSLWLGPVMDSQKGPCWSCAMRRYSQHLRTKTTDETSSDHETQRELQGLGISADVLPIVASGIWNLLRASQLGRFPRGFAWRMDLKSREIIGHNVVGIHRCEVCGLGRKGAEISTKQMSESIDFLYPESKAPL